MRIEPFDRVVGDVIGNDDLSGIVADGISIRSGNRIITLQVSEDTVIDDSEIKTELEQKYKKEVGNMKKLFIQYKKEMNFALKSKLEKLEKEKEELRKRLIKTAVIPVITVNHLRDGLSVASYVGNGDTNGIIWSYKTIYAPKFVNGLRIKPNMAKRLITPITIELRCTDKGKTHMMTVRKIIGGEKFQHYHSLSSSSDCWGSFDFVGEVVKTAEDALELCRKAASVLETINTFSIGTANPRGLSRLSTIEKHLIKEEPEKVEEIKKPKVTSKFMRSGINPDTTGDYLNVWSI